MSYKPDESVLISWMYGELDSAEKAKVDKYLQEHPDELSRIQSFNTVRQIMGNVHDKEVIAPPIFMDEKPTVIPIWRTSSFRTIMTIAASFLLLLVAARLLDLRVAYGSGQLVIAFGTERPAAGQVSGLTAAEVQQMIDQSSIKNQTVLESKLAESRTELDEAIRKTLASNTSRINDLVRQASNASETQVREFVAGLQRENLAQMRDYLQLSSADQKRYTDNLLTEFAKYLQEQRNSDLGILQTRFSRLEQNTDELKVETEQILASIISNSPQVQQGSY